MKKSLILIFPILLISLASAGQIINLNFTENPTIVKEINEGDLFRFEIDGKTHELVLKKVNEEKNSIQITLFVEDSPTPAYISLNYNQRLSLDFYKDKVNDMIIVLESIGQDKARLILRALGEDEKPINKESSEITGSIISEGQNVVAKENNSPDPKTGLVIAAAIVVIGLLIFYIVKK